MKWKRVPAIATLALLLSVTGCQEKPCLPPPVKITAEEKVYEGSAIKLHAEGNSGATYKWSGPNDFSSTEQHPVIPAATLAAGGSYEVTVTEGKCHNSATKEVEVMQGPSCTPQNNTAVFFNNMRFTTVRFGRSSWGRYELYGSGPEGDLSVEFFNDPVEEGDAVYELSTQDRNRNNAFMQINPGGFFGNWQSLSGKLFVKFENGKPVFTFCSVSMVATGSSKAASGKLSVF